MLPTVTQVFWRQLRAPGAVDLLRQALYALALRFDELPSQEVDLVTGKVGGEFLSACAFSAPAGREWSCLHLPPGAQLGGELARAFVSLTGQPSFSLSEYEQVAWGFSLYSAGNPVQSFLSLPSLLDDVPNPPRVDPAVVAGAFQVPVGRVIPYLQVQSADEVSTAYAFPEDCFTLGDPWVRVDFLRTLGIAFPSPASCPEGRFGRLVPDHESRDFPLAPRGALSS